DYIAVTERVTRDYIERKYRNFHFDEPSEDQSAEDRGEIYAGNDYTTSQDEDVYTKIIIYERVDDGIEKTVLINDIIVEETELMEIKCFPIAQLRWKKKLKSPYGIGLM